MDKVRSLSKRPVIVITDGYTLNPGDLTWRIFEDAAELHYYDRTAPEDVQQRCQRAEIIITNKTVITRETIFGAPDLKAICVAATGYNIVDVTAARERNIPVCNVPEYGTHSVAQHTVALLLEVTNHVGENSQAVANGEWAASPDFCFSEKPIIELLDKVVGIVGMGRIGQQVANVVKALGAKVIYHSITPKPDWPGFVTLKELFAQSDFISIHCPQTKENVGFIDASLLSLMKPTAYLINTSRGALINEEALAKALQEGVLAGAALDVLASEPPPVGHPLVGLSNCRITPHTAWLSKEARERIMNVTFANVQRALNGVPQNVVNEK